MSQRKNNTNKFFFPNVEQKEEFLKKQREEKEKLKAFREKVSVDL